MKMRKRSRKTLNWMRTHESRQGVLTAVKANLIAAKTTLTTAIEKLAAAVSSSSLLT